MPSGLLFYCFCLWLCSVVLFSRSILLWVEVSQGMSIKFTDPQLWSIHADSFCCRSHTGHLLALCAAVISTGTLCSLSGSSAHPHVSPFSAGGCPAGWFTPCVSVCFRTFLFITVSNILLLQPGAARSTLAVGISLTSSGGRSATILWAVALPPQVPALCLCHGEVCWAHFLFLTCFNIFLLLEFGARPSSCSFFSPAFPVCVSYTIFYGHFGSFEVDMLPACSCWPSPCSSPLNFLTEPYGEGILLFCSLLQKLCSCSGC